MGALRDCEAVVDSFLGQPVNSLTALAFVAAGVMVLIRSRLPWVGVAMIATGVGSFLFHGPMPSYSEWAHDTTLAWLLMVVAGSGRSWARWAQLPGLAALGLVFAVWPDSADPLSIGLTIVAVVLLLQGDRSMSVIGPIVLLATVGVIGRLGASGGILCNPGSPWQAHGLWHLGAAAAVTWWALAWKDPLPS
jgi:hypothetical protein